MDELRIEAKDLNQQAKEIEDLTELLIKEKAKNMKKLYYVRTNGYDMVVSVDKGDNIRFLTEAEDFPYHPNEEEALSFLEEVDDDSGWDDSYKGTFDDFIAGNEVEVLAQIESERLDPAPYCL